MGKLVACGECEREFRINDETLYHPEKEKFYPGDKPRDLGGFSKKIPEVAPVSEVNFRTIAYDQQVDVAQVMPLGPRRIVAIFFGVSLILLVILAFVLGNTVADGVMGDVDQQRRWVLAGFAALIGGLLIIFGFRKYRRAGILFAAILAIAVAYMPVLYPAKVPPASVPVDEAAIDLEMKQPESESAYLKRYKINIGYVAIDDAIERTGDPTKVVAYALKYSKPEHTSTVVSYLSRELKTTEVPRVYESTRQIGEVPIVLIIFSGIQVGFDEAAKLVIGFGEVATLRPELRVIEVDVLVDKISSTQVSVVGDVSHPNFFQANLGELKQLDQERQLAAIQRIARVEKVGLRADMVRQLMVLFRLPSYPYKPAIAKTLVNWAMPEDGADTMILGDALAKLEQGEQVPHEYLEFLVKQNVQDIGNILYSAWKESPADTERYMLEAGDRAEKVLADSLGRMTPSQLRSASSLLQKIGTKQSLDALRAVYENADEDIKNSLKATIDVIESRD